MSTASQSLNIIHAMSLIAGAMVPVVFRDKPRWAVGLIIALAVSCWIATASLIDAAIVEDIASIARRQAVGAELSMDELAYDGNGDRVFASYLSWLLPFFTAVPAAIVAGLIRRRVARREASDLRASST